jgi:hypothetical protein
MNNDYKRFFTVRGNLTSRITGPRAKHQPNLKRLDRAAPVDVFVRQRYRCGSIYPIYSPERANMLALPALCLPLGIRLALYSEHLLG